jgi:5'/3'-nucleotidase
VQPSVENEQVSRPLILVTNDDGIDSPGLAAAVAALDGLGDLLIVAPLLQQTSMGRSRSQQWGADGRLFRKRVSFGERTWEAVAANATPALAVEHAIVELAPRRIDLAVSGINYGENVGTCVTVSGTIGAALEAAEHGVPALAVSLELSDTRYYTHDAAIDFSAAMHFSRFFASQMLRHTMPHDVDVLKVDVPTRATLQTAWRFVRQDRLVYYQVCLPERTRLFEEPGPVCHRPSKGQFGAQDTDAFALSQSLVAVTPLSLDLTSRVRLEDLRQLFDSPSF